MRSSSATFATSIQALGALLEGRRYVVLTGAGISTESGIPDYRGPETRRRARNPIQYRAFVDDAGARARYWARSLVGWRRITSARPNHGHLALASLERAGAVTGVITQNVDRLHHAAGSDRVIELHGALAEVRCLGCGHLESRGDLQDRLEALNPDIRCFGVEQAPDGDAELPSELLSGFRVPVCLVCGGVLKPNVVFFGESVPRPRVEDAMSLLFDAEALLVVGSSLTVFSGFRFVRRAAEAGIPIGIVNLGPSRGDALAAVRVDRPAGEVLPLLRARRSRAHPTGAPAGAGPP